MRLQLTNISSDSIITLTLAKKNLNFPCDESLETIAVYSKTIKFLPFYEIPDVLFTKFVN